MKFSEWMEKTGANDADVVFLTRQADPDGEGVSMRSIQTCRYGGGCKTLRIAMLLHTISREQVPLEAFVQDQKWLETLRERAEEFDPLP